VAVGARITAHIIQLLSVLPLCGDPGIIILSSAACAQMQKRNHLSEKLDRLAIFSFSCLREGVSCVAQRHAYSNVIA
jgi:hypothetical protein